MSIKTKLISGASALAITGSMMAFAAPAASAAVTNTGSCTGLLALGSAKSTTIDPLTGKGYGITDVDNRDGALSTKGVDPLVVKGTNLGQCVFVGNQGIPDSGKPVVELGKSPQTNADLTEPILKWGTKLFSREFDCNTNDTSDTTEWSPSGSLSFTFTKLQNAGKNRALTAQVTVDGFKPAPVPGDPSDVVLFHGIVIKGIGLGMDVNGETEFDPTLKDKNQTTTTPYPGYGFDIGGALGCTTPAVGDANILLFNNGSNVATGNSQLLNIPVAGISFSKGT